MDIGAMLPHHLRKNEGSSDSDLSDDEDNFGPKLPEHLVQNPAKNREKKSKESDTTRRTEGNKSQVSPSEQVSVGPKLPPHLQERLSAVEKEEDSEESDDDDCMLYGPALPPGFSTSSSSRDHCAVRMARVGPALPPDMGERESSFATSHSKDESSDEGDDDVIGPMPAAGSDSDEYLERAKWEIEARSRATKEQLTGKKDDKMKRETWMTELPPELSKNFGLGPRKFRAHAVELGDQSVWTDTPVDKARKRQEGTEKKKKDEPESKKTAWELKRDVNMEKIVEQHNKRHRDESLMEMHKKKIKKTKEDEASEDKERRPFDRDQDLVVNKVGDKERKAFIKKSQELGTRFQSARQGSAYL